MNNHPNFESALRELSRNCPWETDAPRHPASGWDYTASPEETSPPAPGPHRLTDQRVYPFFPVLFFGVENNHDLRRGPVVKNEAASEMRHLYAVITLVFIVDLAGFSFWFYYMFHSQFTTVASLVLGMVSVVCLGLCYSIIFFLFSLGFAKAPLPDIHDYFQLPIELSDLVLPLVAGFLAAFAAVGLGWWDWDPALSLLDQSRTFISAWMLATLLLTGLMLSARVFGLRTTMYVAVRVTFIVGSGYLVAEPIHLVAYATEIADVYNEDRQGVAKADEKVQQAIVDGQRADLIRECYPSDEAKKQCDAMDTEMTKVELHLSALDLNINRETSGQDDAALRMELTNKAKALDAYDTLGALSHQISGKPRCGTFCQKYKDERVQVERKRDAVIARQKDCQGYAQCLTKAHLEYNTSTTQAKQLIAFKEAQVQDHTKTMGLAQRQAALIRIKEKDQNYTGQAIQHQSVIAWIIAMVGPLALVAMKLMGSRKLNRALCGRRDNSPAARS